MGERRQHTRIVLGQKALLIAGGITLEVVIDDLSADGLSVSTYSPKPLREIGAGKELVLNFQPASGEELSLRCRVKWVDKFLPYGSGFRIGMEIIGPSLGESKAFL